MPKPRNPKDPSEKERFEVLMEEMRSQFRIVIEGLTALTQRVERLEQRMESLEQRMERLQLDVRRLESAILANTTDVMDLRRELLKFTERFEEHEKLHLTA